MAPKCLVLFLRLFLSSVMTSEAPRGQSVSRCKHLHSGFSTSSIAEADHEISRAVWSHTRVTPDPHHVRHITTVLDDVTLLYPP
ncbi:hypothetical protein ACOMHN_027714 [Nucella lapillus]